MSDLWPLPIASDARLSAGAMVWSTPQGQFATVLAKSTLAIDARGGLSIAPPRPLSTRDELEGGHPAKSVVVPSDLAPFVPAAEIVVRGSAWQAAGTTAPTKAVRLGVYRGQKPLVAKVLHVYGERLAAAPRDVRPFTSMPVVWERAVADATNPIGLPARGPGPLPNVIHPTAPGSAAGLCAIPRSWQVRKALLGGAAQGRGELVVDLPAGFPFSFYQCAPADQRTPKLEGDEWIVVEGMHPEHLSVHARLPGLRPVAVAVRPSGRTPVEMKLDLVCVDMDSLGLTLTFRGVAPVARDEAVSFAVTLEDRGSLAPWPEAPAPAVRRDVVAAPLPSIATTHELSDVAHAAARRLDLAPFQVGLPRAGIRAEAPGAPWARPAAPAPTAGEQLRTFELATPVRPAERPPEIHGGRPEPPETFTPPPPSPAPFPAPSAPSPAVATSPAPAPPVEPSAAPLVAAPSPVPPPAAKPRRAPERAKRVREPKTLEAMELELLARGLPREDVRAIVAALKT